VQCVVRLPSVHWVVYGAILATKMMLDDNSPLEQCDRQVKLYTNIKLSGPSDLVLMSIRVFNYILGTLD
jgi:hypothetical protein